MIYLQKLTDLSEIGVDSTTTGVVLRTVDVKDAFLMVEQPSPVMVTLLGKTHWVKRNLPGQRLGAKSWYWHLRQFLIDKLDMMFCVEQPCIAQNDRCCIVVHVDDILFCGDEQYWRETFLKEFAKELKISHSELQGVGSEISFPKRTIRSLSSGLALIPGTSAGKVIELFELHFGKARMQTIPCDQSIQFEDVSSPLNAKDTYHFGSVIGTCLYLARDRPDLLFVEKELSGSMSCPTLTSLQRLRKLVGYLKMTSDICLVLEKPQPGQGRWKTVIDFGF